MRQHAEDVEYLVVARGVGVGMEGDDSAVRDYFNLGTSLDLLSAEWASKCTRYAAVSPFFQGALLPDCSSVCFLEGRMEGHIMLCIGLAMQ